MPPPQSWLLATENIAEDRRPYCSTVPQEGGCALNRLRGPPQLPAGAA